MRTPTPTGQEVRFPETGLIVSKTDLRGVITYANELFTEVCGYHEDELLGRPHSIIRHPEMPRCVFKLLWDTIQDGHEIFAFVVNLCKSGDHYWVFAHVTPDLDPRTQAITGYHSTRRAAYRGAIQTVRPIYQELLEIEARASSKAAGMAASTARLGEILESVGHTYESFVFSLAREGSHLKLVS